MMKLQVLCGIVSKIQEFFHQSDENGVFSIFWSFDGVFHNLNLKMMKINNKSNFL